MIYETVIWDFDGVWSKDWFFQSLKTTHPDVWNFIQTKIYGPGGKGRVDKWMRAQLTMGDINKLISQGTGIDFDLLTKTFIADVASMNIETGHITIVKALKQNGVKVGMVTNNMDVFTSVTTPRLDLIKLFDENVYNSFDYQMMKADGLYDIAIRKIGADYSTALVIDDSPRARAIFEAKGGHTYAYTTFEDFQLWADKNLLV